MTYLSGKAKKRNSYIKYTLYISVFLIIVIFWLFIKKYSYKVIEPVAVRYGITKQSLIIFPEFFSTYLMSYQTLASKNKALEQRVEQLENQLAQKDANLRERVLEGSFFISTTSSQVAPIVLYPIMEDITKLYSTVLLSKGFKDGVTIGDSIYVRGNQVVCTIKEVYNSSSLCQLLTASGVTTEGVTSSSSITLSLIGRGGYYMANIVRDTPVTVGEIVYMRSNPKVIVGTVKEVTTNNQDTSWHVFVEGAYNPLTSSVFYDQP
jgi:cell shape-determining protein MreC